MTNNQMFWTLFLYFGAAGLLIGIMVGFYFTQNPNPNLPLGPIGLGGCAWAAVWLVGNLFAFFLTKD